LCSHLFNAKREFGTRQSNEEGEDEEGFNSPDKVKNCLVRSFKATLQMMEPMDQLLSYSRVLGHAIYFLENGVELPATWFQALTAKIDEEHETGQPDFWPFKRKSIISFHWRVTKRRALSSVASSMS
jgi:hypothetical protein